MKFNVLMFFLALCIQSGGLFALGAATQQDQNSERYMEIGKGITNTCHESYIRTATRLGPEAFRYENVQLDFEIKQIRLSTQSRFLFTFLDLAKVLKQRR